MSGRTSPSFKTLRLSGFLRFMTELASEAKHYWSTPCTIDVDMQSIDDARQTYKDKGLRVTYTAFVIKAIGEALHEHVQRVPELNAAIVRWPNKKIVYFDDIDLSVAAEAIVDGQAVFYGSILRQIDQQTLASIAKQLEDSKDTSPEDSQHLKKDVGVMRLPAVIQKIAMWFGTNSPKQLQQYRGTQFLTSVGQYGVNLLPIGNRNLAFSMGPVETRPVVHNGQIVPRKRMLLNATFDHRTLPGGPVARLLSHIRNLLEDIPSEWHIED